MGRKKSVKKSKVWTIFKQNETSGVDCSVCDKTLNPTGGSTSVLFGHLKTHGIELKSDQKSPSRPSTSTTSQQSMTDFITPKSSR
jgi:hypothetical protein